MPNVEVKCAVSNCIFHAKGNVCGAEKIEIDMDTMQTTIIQSSLLNLITALFLKKLVILQILAVKRSNLKMKLQNSISK